MQADGGSQGILWVPRLSPMLDWPDQQLAWLRPLYPDWELWVVRMFRRGTIWCARPKGTESATINVSSPEELIAAIADEDANSQA
jgi:hypothetical protein